MRRNSWLILLLLYQMMALQDFSTAQNPVRRHSDFSDSLHRELLDLKWSEQEVQAINRIFDGKIFLHQHATEENFKRFAPNATIIHIATHALIDDHAPLYSRFLFSPGHDSAEDGQLHSYELYNMPLNASLAVLSACNTGAGRLVSGEGIMSLARAFL